MVEILKDITTKIGSGATPTGGSEAYKEEGISLIRSQNVLDLEFSYDGLAFIDDVQAHELRNVTVEEKDVLLNITGDSVARACMVPCKVLPARVNQHVAIIRAKEGVLDSYYLLYNLIYQKESLLSYSEVGATRRALTKGIIENFQLILPPLPEQQAIAEVLSSLDDKIDLLHRNNKTLEAMAETLFRQLNTYPSKNVPLTDVFDFKEGPGIRNWQYTEEGVRFINIRLIENGDINIRSANYVSTEEAMGKYQHFLLDVGDMVVSTSGTLGKSAIVREYHLPLLLNTSVIRFRPKEEIYRTFMYRYLQSSQFLDALETHAGGSVQLNFGPTHLKQLSIEIPEDIKATESFYGSTINIYEKMSLNFNQIQILQTLRDTLLPKLMSGEVRVNQN